MDILLSLILLVILIGLSAFFSGIETAFFSVSKIKARMLMEQKKPKAKILYKLKEKPQRVLITILIGNNIVNIGAAGIAAVIAIRTFGSIGIGIATAVMTFLILVFGEITPKSLAIAHAEGISLAIARPIQILGYILFPFVLFFEKIAMAATKATGVKEQPLITEKEIKTMVEIGAEEKVIEERERRAIRGILQFNDITAEEVMTPRTEMFCLNANLSLAKVLDTVIKSQFNRIPIYVKSKDNIVGILYVRDVLKNLSRRRLDVKLRDIAKRPFFITQEEIISNLFRKFQKKHIHIAVVVDEYGGTAGLVTLEDLIEEVVGQIIDETDISPELIKRVDKKTILVHGKTEIDDINDFFNTTLSEDERTISGLILAKLKRIPKKGTKIRLERVEIVVHEVTEKEILKVFISKL